MNFLRVDPIAYIKTPFYEKFGVPRQPLLIPEAKGEIHFIKPYNELNMIQGLEQFSHLWLLFFFNQTADQGWKPQVRPPRLGGNQKMGVLATRSNFRPNPIGLSVVKLDEITTHKNTAILKVSGVDLITETPILDIKPYLPYCDAVFDAKAGFAQNAPAQLLTVHFNDKALDKLNYDPKLIKLITKLIEQDPRPAYKRNQNRPQRYGMRIYHFNIEFEVLNTDAKITQITSK